MVPTTSPALRVHLNHIRSQRFVKGVSTTHDLKQESAIAIDTPEGTFHFRALSFRSYLDRTLVSAIVSRVREVKSKDASDLIVLARYIPRPTGELLAKHEVNFVDEIGNMNLCLGPHYRALILGRLQPHRPFERRRLGHATIQVLFAYAAFPGAVNWPVRRLAEFAGVGKTAAADARNRLLKERIVQRLRTGGYRILDPNGVAELCMSGYSQLLRPRLLIGKFRSAKRDAEELLHQITRFFEERNTRWALTGGPSAYSLNRFYRGQETAIFLEGLPPGFERELKLLPDEDGPVILLRAFGPLVFWKTVKQVPVAHPWLIYAELMHQENPRAHEAAELVRKAYLSV